MIIQKSEWVLTVKLFSICFVGDLEEALTADHAGVINEDVDGLGDGLGGGVDRASVGHVAHDAQGARAKSFDLVDDNVEAGAIDIPKIQRAAALGDTQRHQAAEAACGTGYHHVGAPKLGHGERFYLLYWRFADAGGGGRCVAGGGASAIKCWRPASNPSAC